MKAGDARAMTPDQLSDELMKLKKEQFNLRFQRATGQLENTSRVREVRRDIARLKTIMRQKRVGAEPATTAAAPEAGTKPKAKATAKRAPRAKAKPATRAKAKSKSK